MRKLLLFTLSFNVCYCLFGQTAKEQLAIVNAAQITTSEFYQEIPYLNKFGYVIIPVTIGLKTYQYIFDTGGYNTITSQIIADNSLPELMQVEVGSANQIKSKIALTKIPRLTLGDLQITDVGALNFDFLDSPAINCYTNGGLFGKSIIKNAVWQINAQEGTIIVTNNADKLSNLDNAIRIKVKLDKVYNPFIKAKINGKTYTFLLDFGFNGLLSLTQKDGVALKSNAAVEIIGEGAAGANGILKESTFITPIKDFTIGKQQLTNKFAYYAKSNNYNLIGAGITQYFVVTLNFKENELYLTPISPNQEQPEKKESSFGFSLNQNDQGIYVSSLFKAGGAAKTGLQLNDIILSINNVIFDNKPYCEFYDYFKALLDKDDPIILEVKRGNSIEKLQIKKTTMFN